MDEFYEINKEFITNPVNNTAKKIKAGIMTYLPSVVLTLILLVLSGLGALLQFNFSIKDIVWTTFFISLGLRLVSNFLSKYVGSNLAYNKALYSDEMQSLKKDFINAGKNIDRTAFEKYIYEYNLENKKKAYKNKKRMKIQALNEKKSLLTFRNKLDYSKRRANKITKLEHKKDELTSISTDDYIDENISYIKVKYAKVRSYYFLSPSEDYVEDGIRYKVNFSKENTKEILKSLPLTVALVFFSALLAYDVAVGKVNAVSILFDIANMVFNFIIGWFTVGKKIASRMMNAYINRQTFILEFKAKYESKNEKTVAMATEKCSE